MSQVMTKEECFQTVLFECDMRESKAELLAKCEAAGMWTPEELARATRAYKSADIRRLAKQKGWVDKDGNPVKLYNVVGINPRSGKKQRMYVDLRYCNFAERVQIVTDYLKRSEYCLGQAKEVYDDSCRVYGRKFQKLFQF